MGPQIKIKVKKKGLGAILDIVNSRGPCNFLLFIFSAFFNSLSGSYVETNYYKEDDMMKVKNR